MFLCFKVVPAEIRQQAFDEYVTCCVNCGLSEFTHRLRCRGGRLYCPLGLMNEHIADRCLRDDDVKWLSIDRFMLRLPLGGADEVKVLRALGLTFDDPRGKIEWSFSRFVQLVDLHSPSFSDVAKAMGVRFG